MARPWWRYLSCGRVTDVLLPVAEAEEAISGGESDRDEPSNAEAVGSPQREVEENRLPAEAGEEVRGRMGTAEEAPEEPIVLRRSQREKRKNVNIIVSGITMQLITQ